jgi:hypothetical protein
MTADEALEHGFIDRVASDGSVSNTWNLSAYAKAPPALTAPPVRAATLAPEPTPAPAPTPAAVSNTMSQANRNRLALIQADL